MKDVEGLLGGADTDRTIYLDRQNRPKYYSIHNGFQEAADLLNSDYPALPRVARKLKAFR